MQEIVEWYADKIGKNPDEFDAIDKHIETVIQTWEKERNQELNIPTVTSWVAVKDRLPNDLETVWISNGKGWTTLGCIAYAEGGWHWAETNGVIYQEDGKIVSECESDDLDVKFWHSLPEPPCL